MTAGLASGLYCNCAGSSTAGFEALVAQENSSARGRLNGGAMISTSPNERALLGCLLAKLAALDADVLVGHNIGAYELAVLMGRLQTHKVLLQLLLHQMTLTSTIWIELDIAVNGCLDQECGVAACSRVMLTGRQGDTVAAVLTQFV
jgi:hypothetical protein